jgi:tetratricopeptide (TPR) repeat protein
MVFLVGICFAGGPSYRVKQELETKTLSDLREIEIHLKENPETAVTKIATIIKFSIRQDLNQSTSFAYLLMGRAYKNLRQPQLAIHFLNLANDSYANINYKNVGKKQKIIVQAIPQNYYWDLAEVNQQLGNYEVSITNYQEFKKLTISEDKMMLSDYAIALNYYALTDYNIAVDLYSKILDKELKNQNEEDIRYCYSRLAACYIELGNTDQGLKYYQLSIQGIELDKAVDKDRKEVAANKEIVSKALRNQSKYSEELDIRTQTLSMSTGGVEHLKLAQAYFKSDDIKNTEKSLDNYIDDVSYDVIDVNEINVLKEMALILQNQNNNKKAFQYLMLFEELTDTIDNRLFTIENASKRLGKTGYQNYLQLEILQKDKEISKNTIAHLMNESRLKEENLSFQKILIILMGIVIVVVIIALLYIIRVSKQRRIANQKLALRSLRTQMNPHFIFNALNSVNSFISSSDERAANKFLTEFSTLMRTVMENSEHDFIPLSKELEILKIYLDLEHFRFKDKFDYELEIQDNLEMEEFVIPPMLIQPYIENAIWHGLRYKDDKGKLLVNVSSNTGSLKIKISDDGIGRNKSEEIKTKNQKKVKSTALKNINERVKLFNNLHKIKVDVSLNNLYEDGSGTVVIIEIPQSHNE